jgi:hypothetical protein
MNNMSKHKKQYKRTQLAELEAKYDALKQSHDKLAKALGNMVEQFITYTNFDHEKCWEIIQARQVIAEAEKLWK